MNKAIVIFAIALLGASNASADNQCDSGAAFLGGSRAQMSAICDRAGGNWGSMPKGGSYCELGKLVILVTYKSGKIAWVDMVFTVSSALEAFEIVGGCLETYGMPTKQSEKPPAFLWVRGKRHTSAMLLKDKLHVATENK